jgi:hypothetical protein
MEDGLDLAVTLGFHARQELVLIRIVSDREVGEIVDLVAVGEVVDDQYVAHAAGVESRHDVGADHAGAARYNDHEASALSQSLENRRPYSEGEGRCRQSAEPGRHGCAGAVASVIALTMTVPPAAR